MVQRKELDELKEIARLATYDALKEFEPLSIDWRNNLTLGSGIDGDYGIFELYVAAERPENAVIISSARVNRKTRAVEVTISNLTRIN